MKNIVSNPANKVLTAIAKMFAKTGCVVICHRPEAPEELFSK